MVHYARTARGWGNNYFYGAARGGGEVDGLYLPVSRNERPRTHRIHNNNTFFTWTLRDISDRLLKFNAASFTGKTYDRNLGIYTMWRARRMRRMYLIVHRHHVPASSCRRSLNNWIVITRNYGRYSWKTRSYLLSVHIAHRLVYWFSRVLAVASRPGRLGGGTKGNFGRFVCFQFQSLSLNVCDSFSPRHRNQRTTYVFVFFVRRSPR